MADKLEKEGLKLLKYIDDINKVNRILKSINRYTTEYINTNNILYLKDAIFETQLHNILSAIIKFPTLITIIMEEKIDIDNIAYLQIETIIPELLLKLKKKEDDTFDSGFTCSKCKSTNCRQIVKQTRAADEPPDIFIECISCGYKKKS